MPKLRNKKFVAVRDNGLGKAMITIPMIKKKLCNIRGCESHFTRNKFEVSAETVCNSEYTIIT